MTKPPSKPISLRFPNNITLSYFGIEKSVHRFLLYQKIYLVYYFPNKNEHIFARCPCPMNQTCTVPKFSETNLNHLPSLTQKIHNLCKSIRNNFKNPTSFRDFVGGENSLHPFIQPAIIWGGDSPTLIPSEKRHLHITTTQLGDSCRKLTSKTFVVGLPIPKSLPIHDLDPRMPSSHHDRMT